MFTNPFSAEKRRAARRERAEIAHRRAQECGETSTVRLPNEGLSTQKILSATIGKIRALAPEITGDYLDVGSGNGELIDRVVREFPVVPQACDYRDDLMTIGGLRVDVVNLNTGGLP
ncbi:MAG: hypothetical protein H0U88_08480, partial [Chthoniobacterales bacterium]|nr:hypothetical protein [Chthoniobacterales bacterium]